MSAIRSYSYYVFIGLLLLLPLSACGPKYKAAKARKQTEKQLEQRRKEGERTLQQGKQRHLKVQSKETQRRMKQTRRQSQRLIKSQKSPFYKRWYNAIRKR